MFPARGVHVPWGPSAAILVSLALIVGSQVLIAAIFIPLLVGSGVAETWFESTIGQFTAILAIDAIILVSLWLFLRSRRASLRQLGFARRPVWLDIGRALVWYGIYFVLLITAGLIVDAFTPVNVQQKQELGFEDLASPAALAMGFVALVVLPPIVEETVFRGFVFTGLRTRLTFLWTTIITSLLFAWPHLLASSEGLLWIAGIDTLLLSFVLCYLREKTGALWAPIAVHAIKNAIAYLILISTVTS